MGSASARSETCGDLGLRAEVRILRDKYRLNACLECGKCTAVCPMVEFYGEFENKRCTRNIVERLAYASDSLEDEALWYCLACEECTSFCPSGVDFQNFMTAFRNLLVAHGYREHAYFCAACGTYLMPKHQQDVLKKKMNGTDELLDDCPTCKKNRFANAFAKASAKGKSFPFFK